MARRRQVNRKIPQQTNQPKQKQAGFLVKNFASIAIIIGALIACGATITGAFLTGVAPLLLSKVLSSPTATVSASTPTVLVTHSLEPSSTATYGFEDGVEHWFAQETGLKRSKVDVTTDHAHSGSHSLRLTTVLIGNGNHSFPGQEFYTHSEATVNFDQPPPGLNVPGPYNLTGKPVSCFVYLPAALAVENTPQAFIRMSVKDRGAANDYGPMILIDSSHVEQWFQISLTIGKGDEPDKTFDPKRVWSIVVLLETTENATLSFNGSIYIDDCFVGHI